MPFNRNIERKDLIFSDAIDAFFKGWGSLEQIRTVVGMAIPKAYDEYRDYMSEFMDTMRPGREHAHLLYNADEHFQSGQYEEFLNNAVPKVLEQSRVLIEASVYVLAHSRLEAFIDECLDIANEADPCVFHKFIQNMEVKIAAILDETASSVITQKAQKYVAGLKRESIIKRLDVLHAIWGNNLPAYTGNCKYSKERIQGIDRRRQEIIHKNEVLQSLSEMNADMDYMFRLNGYLIHFMHARFDVVIIADPKLRESLWKQYRK